MKNTPLQNWFHQQKRKKNFFVPLYQGILSSSGWRYLFYRLRYFALTVIICSLIHMIEFGVIFHFIGIKTLVSAALIRGIFFATNGAYWGFLEIFRSQVRVLYRKKSYRLLYLAIRIWLILALVLGLVIAISFFVTSIWLTQSFDQYSLFLKIYAICLFIELIFQLLVVTFHASVFSLRRVYRPSASIWGSDCLGLALLIVLWPFLQVYSLPIAQVLSRFSRLFLSYYFTKRTFSMLAFPKITKTVKMSYKKLLSNIFSLEALLAASSSLIMRCEGIIILLLFALHPAQNMTHDLLILFFFLISPFILYGFSWAKLFYFDFKLLERFPLNSLANLLLQKSLRCAYLIGAIFWCLTLITALCFEQSLVHFAFLLLPFFILRAPISILQIKAFSTRRYYDVILSGALTLASLMLITITSLSTEALFVGLSLMMSLSLLYLILIKTRPIENKSRDYDVLPLYDWVCSYQNHIQQNLNTSLEIWSLGTGISRPQTHMLINKLARYLGDHGAITQLSTRKILVYFQLPDHKSHQRMLLLGAGFIAANAKVNLDDLFVKSASNAAHDLSDLCQQQFKDALIIPTNGRIPSDIKLDYAQLKGAVWRTLKWPWVPQILNGYRLSIEINKDGIKNFFLIPQSTHGNKFHKIWEQTVIQHNYLALMYHSTPAKKPLNRLKDVPA